MKLNKILLILLCCCLCCCLLCSTVTATNIRNTEYAVMNFAEGDLKGYNYLYPLECEIIVDGVTKNFKFVNGVVDEPGFWICDYHDTKSFQLDKSYDHYDKIRIKFKLERKFGLFYARTYINKFWINVTDYIKSTNPNENTFSFRIKMDEVMTKADGFNMYDLNGKLLKHFDIYY